MHKSSVGGALRCTRGQGPSVGGLVMILRSLESFLGFAWQRNALAQTATLSQVGMPPLAPSRHKIDYIRVYPTYE